MSTPIKCAGCHKEAHRSNGMTIPLKRCSRCRKAFYHDRICQAKHYKQHRAVCASNLSVNGVVDDQRIVQDVSQQALDSPDLNNRSLFSIEYIPGKGKSLVTATSLDTGCFIPSNQDEGIPPLVHPAIFQSCRRTHCVWCFGILRDSTKLALFDHSIASYFVCASTCREQISSTLLDEINALKHLYISTDRILGPPVLLPTALLVFRMIHVVKKGIVSEAALAAMATHNVPLSEDARVHQEAISVTARTLVRASSLSDVEDDTITRFLGYAKYNSFTITQDGTSVGVGLFQSPAHFVNHSCRPNGMQLFQLRPGSAPMLRLVVTRPVNAGDEICISYNSEKENASSRERKEDLYQNYSFWCNCELCREEK